MVSSTMQRDVNSIAYYLAKEGDSSRTICNWLVFVYSLLFLLALLDSARLMPCSYSTILIVVVALLILFNKKISHLFR